MKLSDSSKIWQRFRLVAMSIASVFFIACAAFLVSYFEGRQTLIVGDRERSYYLHLPTAYDEGVSYPLVLVFHMRMGNAWMMREISQFDRLADQEGFIVVFPEGYHRSWADGSGLYEADGAAVDDLLFVQTLLARVTSRFSIDERRVYVTGFSNGGFFAHRLACEMPEEIAAVGTVSAVLAEDVLRACDPGKPVPVLMMHGSADQDLPLEGKPPQLSSVRSLAEMWVEVNDCLPSPTVDLLDPLDDATQVTRESYSECQNQAEVVLYVIKGGGHKWPGASSFLQFWLSGNLSEDVDATSTIWEFFERHSGLHR